MCDTGSFIRKLKPEEITRWDVLILGRIKPGESERKMLRQVGTE